MTKLESNKVVLDKPSATIFNFLIDFNNFEKLMPQQVTNWKSTGEDCSFTIQGMATLGMKYAEKIPHTEVRIVPNGKVPFDFKLTCLIAETATGCEAQLVMDADLNPFLKMMAEKPLTNFLNLLVERLKLV